MSCRWDTTEPRFYWKQPDSMSWECAEKRRRKSRRKSDRKPTAKRVAD